MESTLADRIVIELQKTTATAKYLTREIKLMPGFEQIKTSDVNKLLYTWLKDHKVTRMVPKGTSTPVWQLVIN